ncbi:trans-aconitate 2-methyltransferase [Plakobranchus ocellatus]|uniref:Trans-aconitate 2-methyltransferase n=1 Tax=Plakobranchus ocellatus TaxID=259542 RepID=A0AAV4CYZ2_9GAST|nr:trans-aconitate 2-methyltransferase [Plakobranchus ocellatus]
MANAEIKCNRFSSVEQTKAYVKYRPRYSDELFKVIVDYCKETISDLNVAVDVGCGPGTSTVGFVKYFKKVIGVDASEFQVAGAPKDIPNLEFRQGFSDKLPFVESGTVDLFCSGESFHLMPQQETFAEADRVLRPGGTLALFGYHFINAVNPDIKMVLQKPIPSLCSRSGLQYLQSVNSISFNSYSGLQYLQSVNSNSFTAILGYNIYSQSIPTPSTVILGYNIYSQSILSPSTVILGYNIYSQSILSLSTVILGYNIYCQSIPSPSKVIRGYNIYSQSIPSPSKVILVYNIYNHPTVTPSP